MEISGESTITFEPPSGSGLEEDGFGPGDEWDETLAQINMNFQQNREEPNKPCSSVGRTYTYKNVPIRFPYPAYRSQHQMMEKIIEGVTTGENCLLESPTGTGKTAALLCALLGWQKNCYKTWDFCHDVIQAAVEKMGGCTCGLIKDKEWTTVILEKDKKGQMKLKATTRVMKEEEETEENIPQPSGVTRNDSCCEKANTTNTCTPPTTPKKTNCFESNQATQSNLNPPGTDEQLESLPSPRKRQKRLLESEMEEEIRSIDKACAYCVRKHVVDRSRPPRIYYLTRTHSQIAQVIKQLKGTAYRNTQMTILAGREPTCLLENVLKEINQMSMEPGSSQEDNEFSKPTIDDHCRTLKKNFLKIKRENPDDNYDSLSEHPDVCKFFRTKNELERAFADLQHQGAWDLEDIKKEGKKCGRCPYFGCHALHTSADIIFGSYNYLLQPGIRNAADVKYINSVLVFDEAHNIEDICRSAFSVTIDVHHLDKYRKYVDQMLINAGSDQKNHVLLSTIRALQKVSVTMKQWSDKILEWGNLEVDNKHKDKKLAKILDIKKSYESEELHDALVEMNMTAESLTQCVVELRGENDENGASGATEDEEEEYYFDRMGNKVPFRISSKVSEFLKKIRQSLKYLFEQEMDGIGGAKDFKGYLTGVANPKKTGRSSMGGGASRRSLNLPQQSQPITTTKQAQTKVQPLIPAAPDYFFKLEIICLNPALGFRVLRNTAYSIIVASGTLTPLNSFASELATKFNVRLQADHVIPESNVLTGVISKGPSGKSLHLNKTNQGDEVIQDDIGKLIKDICNTVPNGVLVFFPSYTLMHKLEERWRHFPPGNSILHQITRRKMLFKEESKDKNAFKLNMQRYKEFVKGGYNCDGCVLFAVFRGKISEGIDFADEQARAVVNIGIPFSNVGAADIVSKKSYNDKRMKGQKPGENILSGKEWYTTQAFRAMNQGFGRCVRHSDDWGALILIDSRLASHNFNQYISGWVRKSKRAYQNFSEFQPELKSFIERMKRKPKKVKIEYEPEPELETTQLVSGSDYFQMDSQDDAMLTQVASNFDHHSVHNKTTQVVPWTSTPIPAALDLEVDTIAESSPEYSFSEEANEILGGMPSPVLPVFGGGITRTREASVTQEIPEHSDDSDSSVSVFERTPDKTEDDDDGNASDKELFDMVEQLESSVDNEMQQTSQKCEDEANKSDSFDVSMPSANASLEMSQGSDISYHSDWDRSTS